MNHQLPAQQRRGVTGTGNDKSCRQRLVNSFTYLQPHSHTIQRSWLGAAQSCPGSQPLPWPCSEPCKSENPGWERVRGGEMQGQDRQGTKPVDFISISQFPSAFYPTGHIGQGHFLCSYLRETSISLWLVLF